MTLRLKSHSLQIVMAWTVKRDQQWWVFFVLFHVYCITLRCWPQLGHFTKTETVFLYQHTTSRNVCAKHFFYYFFNTGGSFSNQTYANTNNWYIKIKGNWPVVIIVIWSPYWNWNLFLTVFCIFRDYPVKSFRMHLPQFPQATSVWLKIQSGSLLTDNN